MDRIRFALLLFLMVASGQAFADEYQIRVSYNTNLRSGPSLKSQIVSIATSNMVLLVVDESGDWLQLDLSGETVYMANWAPYTRLGGGRRITTEYADYECEDGPRWYADDDYVTGGYWVFKKDDCKLTVRSPLGAFPSEAFAVADTVILVEGPEEIVRQVRLALDKLRDVAPKWHAFVANAVDKIIGYAPGSEYDSVSGDAYVHPHLKTMFISRFAAFSSTGNILLRLASVLVHEACHVHQVETKMALSGDEYEIMCHALEFDTLDDLGASRYSIIGTENALSSYFHIDWF